MVKQSLLRFILLILTSTIFFSAFTYGQETVYNWTWKKDGYILGGSAIFWAGSNYLKVNAEKITSTDLLVLDKENIWSFDRSAADNYDLSADNLSDYCLFGSIALPFTPYLFPEGRREGFNIIGMAFESYFIGDGIVNVIKATTKRFRPFTYNSEVPDAVKLGDTARYSFMSGHTSTVANMSFFSAKVFSDMYPDSKWKSAIWVTASVLPAFAGYLRYDAGQHFPTDIIGGYIVGASIGYLIPSFYANKQRNLNLTTSNNGIRIDYTF